MCYASLLPGWTADAPDDLLPEGQVLGREENHPDNPHPFATGKLVLT